jgi:transcription antitermination factor NusG
VPIVESSPTWAQEMAEHAQGEGGMDISRWYVVHCEAQRDRQVATLTQSGGLESYAPRIPKTRKRNGDKALFPGYVFVRMSLSGGAWGSMRRLPGVRSLVEIGGGPCPVDDTVVEAIRRWVASRPVPSSSPRVGERVTVRSGAFAQLEGIVCETLSGTARVAVLMDMMRRQVRVVLPLDSVEVRDSIEVAA